MELSLIEAKSQKDRKETVCYVCYCIKITTDEVNVLNF